MRWLYAYFSNYEELLLSKPSLLLQVFAPKYLKMKQSIILSIEWFYLIREADGCLFCSLSLGNMKLLRGILSFTLLEIRTKVAMTVEPPVTKRPLKMQRIIAHQNKTTGVFYFQERFRDFFFLIKNLLNAISKLSSSHSRSFWNMEYGLRTLYKLRTGYKTQTWN